MSQHAITRFSANSDYDYEIRTTLGFSVEGAAEPGEILAAVSGVGKWDHEAWYAAWYRLAERTLATAQKAAAGGHAVSASAAYLRASAYYAVAVNAQSALADSGQLASTFAKQQQAWSGFVAHTPVQVTEVAIPYEQSTLPGWFFRRTTPRPSARRWSG